jgi:DNA invertase Pin-like site-specific DNA recombinase
MVYSCSHAPNDPNPHPKEYPQMATEITDAALHQLLTEGLSQNEIARRTGIPRSTLRRRLEKLSTPQVDTGVPEEPNESTP